MELLMWRWSTTVQTVSALMIAVFFLVLARPVRRADDPRSSTRAT
jgi:hypothetical protein